MLLPAVNPAPAETVPQVPSLVHLLLMPVAVALVQMDHLATTSCLVPVVLAAVALAVVILVLMAMVQMAALILAAVAVAAAEVQVLVAPEALAL